MTKIVVFAFETTGNKSTDRILEIAEVIWGSESQAIVGEFETLIHPSRHASAMAGGVYLGRP